MNDLFQDSAFLVLLGIAVGWPVVALIVRFAMLNLLDQQRGSEYPRQLLKPLSLFFATSALLLAVPHLDDALSSGTLQDFTVGAINAALRVASGIVLWLGVYTTLDLTHREFTQRRYRAFGLERQRNTAEIFNTLAGALAALVIVAYVAWLFELNVTGYLVAFGGVSVALAFGLQSVLKNIISGIQLALEMPFGENDLIRIEQDTFQVLHRGLDVTVVRNITTHETVYLPNTVLSESPLVEITRPTDDLRSIIEVGVAYDAPLRDVHMILREIALGHPNIVGPIGEKSKEIRKKTVRLYIRRIFPEMIQHFMELARLEAEEECNRRTVDLGKRLESWAAYVDEAESRGFDKNEQKWLASIAAELDEVVSDLIRLTTAWQVMVRNSLATRREVWPFEPGRIYWSGREEEQSPFTLDLSQTRLEQEAAAMVGAAPNADASIETRFSAMAAGLAGLVSEEGVNRIRDATAAIVSSSLGGQAEGRSNDFHMEFDAALLAHHRLRELPELKWPGLTKDQRVAVQPALEGFAWSFGRPESFLDAACQVRLALAASSAISQRCAVPPQSADNAEQYERSREHMNKVADQINWLGNAFGGLARHYADAITTNSWRYGQAFAISDCRTRAENEHESLAAVDHILDHPLCSAISGAVADPDDRHDLGDLFRMWGDKCKVLENKAKHIRHELSKGDSATIDTELRELARWLKDDFKDPYPAWKYPITSVEQFADSSIVVAVKFYVDNVRLDKFMRPFATYAQFRQRIVERFENEHITIPFPQRDVHFDEPHYVDPRAPQRDL